MFKPELWQSHNEYRTIVNSLGKRLSRNNPRYQFDTHSKERQKLLSLNPDPLMDYLPQFYFPAGRPAKNQTQLLRSLILFIPCSSTELTQKPASPHGFGMFSPTPFPLPAFVGFPLLRISLPLALIMTLWTVFGLRPGNNTPGLPSSPPERMAKSLQRRLATMESLRKIPPIFFLHAIPLT